MTTELSSFARRVHGFIQHCPAGFCADSGPGSRDSDFNALAVALFQLQFRCNVPYRRWCDAQGTRPESVTHWTQIPAVPAAAFKEWDLTCLAPAERTRVFESSGTTGQRPSRHFHGADSLALYETSLWAWWRHHVPDGFVADRCLILTPPAGQAPHSSLVHMFDFVRQQLGAGDGAFVGRVNAAGAWELDFERLLLRVTGDGPPSTASAPDRQSQPWLVLGTAFSFVQLLDELARRDCRLRLPVGSYVLETGGYKGRSRVLPKAGLYQLITAWLGVPVANIVCEYGMSELSSQAYDLTGRRCEGNAAEFRHFQFPNWARARVISPETGREVEVGGTGLLRIYDLANVFSVLAIQTEDLAVRRSTGFALLGRAGAAEPRGCSLMPA